MDNQMKEFKKNILLEIKEKLELKKDYIGFLIWQRKHDAINRKYSNLFQPPIKLDFNPADYEDTDAAKVTLEQALSLLREDNKDDVVKQEEKNEEKEEKENIITSSEILKDVYYKLKNNEMNIKDLSAADLAKVYAMTLQEAELKSDIIEESIKVEEEIKQLEEENKNLEKEIEDLKKQAESEN